MCARVVRSTASPSERSQQRAAKLNFVQTSTATMCVCVRVCAG